MRLVWPSGLLQPLGATVRATAPQRRRRSLYSFTHPPSSLYSFAHPPTLHCHRYLAYCPSTCSGQPCNDWYISDDYTTMSAFASSWASGAATCPSGTSDWRLRLKKTTCTSDTTCTCGAVVDDGPSAGAACAACGYNGYSSYSMNGEGSYSCTDQVRPSWLLVASRGFSWLLMASLTVSLTVSQLLTTHALLLIARPLLHWPGCAHPWKRRTRRRQPQRVSQRKPWPVASRPP